MSGQAGSCGPGHASGSCGAMHQGVTGTAPATPPPTTGPSGDTAVMQTPDAAPPAVTPDATAPDAHQHHTHRH